MYQYVYAHMQMTSWNHHMPSQEYKKKEKEGFSPVATQMLSIPGTSNF